MTASSCRVLPPATQIRIRAPYGTLRAAQHTRRPIPGRREPLTRTLELSRRRHWRALRNFRPGAAVVCKRQPPRCFSSDTRSDVVSNVARLRYRHSQQALGASLAVACSTRNSVRASSCPVPIWRRQTPVDSQHGPVRLILCRRWIPRWHLLSWRDRYPGVPACIAGRQRWPMERGGVRLT